MLGVRLARAAFAPATWPLPPRHATRFYSTPAEATAAEPTPEAATTTADTSQNTPEVKSGSGDKPKPPPLAPLLASSLHNNRKKIKKDSKGRRIVRPVPTDFGSAFTENMITINWNSVQGWTSPIVRPLHSLQLHPGASVLQYAFTCFEGMKAYKGQDGQVRLFRPELNAHRFLKSAQRLALPSFDPQELLKIIHRFVSLERHEVPETRGSSLYLRPVLFGTSSLLRVSAPTAARLVIVGSPVGPYHQTGLQAVSLEATSSSVRAWPGGVGDMKLGANYSPTVVAQVDAASRGHQQNLWLFGEEDYVTEAGTMNFFAAIRNKETGQNELITPPLDGLILEGITRLSTLELARERLVPEGWKVLERRIPMKELEDAANDGRLLEVFATGTAAVVCSVRTISWNNRTINCGIDRNMQAGSITNRLKNWIEGIQFGDEEHSWAPVVECE